jgi:hypothetical protein
MGVGKMTNAGDLAEEVAREAGVSFDRKQHDHDEILLVVGENSNRHSQDIADLRAEVRQLETKLDGIGSRVTYVLCIAAFLLGAVAFSQIGIFKP